MPSSSWWSCAICLWMLSACEGLPLLCNPVKTPLNKAHCVILLSLSFPWWYPKIQNPWTQNWDYLSLPYRFLFLLMILAPRPPMSCIAPHTSLQITCPCVLLKFFKILRGYMKCILVWSVCCPRCFTAFILGLPLFWFSARILCFLPILSSLCFCFFWFYIYIFFFFFSINCLRKGCRR